MKTLKARNGMRRSYSELKLIQGKRTSDTYLLVINTDTDDRNSER